MNNINSLSPEDADLFYTIWFRLLDHVNHKYNILPGVQSFEAMKNQNAIEPVKAKQVANVIWGDGERDSERNSEATSKEIDDYLDKNKNLPEDQREIILSWKRQITGVFIIERHLKEGTIFITDKRTAQSVGLSSNNTTISGSEDGDGEVYLVRGISSSVEDMFSNVSLPRIVSATLIPFKHNDTDVIITDGLVRRFEVFMGKNVKQLMKDAYIRAKWEKRIHTTL